MKEEEDYNFKYGVEEPKAGSENPSRARPTISDKIAAVGLAAYKSQIPNRVTNQLQQAKKASPQDQAKSSPAEENLGNNRQNVPYISFEAISPKPSRRGSRSKKIRSNKRIPTMNLKPTIAKIPKYKPPTETISTNKDAPSAEPFHNRNISKRPTKNRNAAQDTISELKQILPNMLSEKPSEEPTSTETYPTYQWYHVMLNQNLDPEWKVRQLPGLYIVQKRLNPYVFRIISKNPISAGRELSEKKTTKLNSIFGEPINIETDAFKTFNDFMNEVVSAGCISNKRDPNTKYKLERFIDNEQTINQNTNLIRKIKLSNDAGNITIEINPQNTGNLEVVISCKYKKQKRKNITTTFKLNPETEQLDNFSSDNPEVFMRIISFAELVALNNSSKY